MSTDNLGLNQTRVLDDTDRSFESITYQTRKPPLSSEVNLGGKIDSDRSQKIMQYLIPSGWAQAGQILDNVSESSCQAGDVVCSPTYAANTFKLISLDYGINNEKNVAWVNGERILVQGSRSSDENNIIQLDLPPTTSSRVDFVFLEVWRKLIYPGDPIFKYGNFWYGGVNPANDLIDPVMGIETSLRIQLQYRIRVAPIDISNYPEGFDPNSVFVQGPLSNPCSTCVPNYFTQSTSDIGLWLAGLGDDVAQENLSTVDGHTYAIPMFAVRRRNSSAYDPNLNSNGSGMTLANYTAGYASDRPDNLYNNWIQATDILDLRHKIVSEQDLKSFCDFSFRQLMNNQLRGKMTKSSLGGGDQYGIEVTQADAISNVDLGGSVKIGTGDGVKRIFSNATLTQSESFVNFTTNQKQSNNGNPWVSGDSVEIILPIPSVYGTGTAITAVKEVSYKNTASYSLVVVPVIGYAASFLSNGALITLNSSAGSILGTSYGMRIEYTISYPTGNFASGETFGLSEVPTKFLESRKEGTSLSIAMQDQDIPVRTAAPVVTNDGTHFNMLSNRGGYTTEPYDFGHQMTYHVVGNGLSSFTIPRILYGYTVLGVVNVKDYSLPYSRVSPTVTRDANNYTVNVGSPVMISGDDIAVTLYVQSKFFEGNKQARGITNCFEMLEITPDETSYGGTTFHIDSIDKKIIAIGSYITEGGNGYAYADGSRVPLSINNSSFPLDSTKTCTSITFTAPPSGALQVPVLVQSAIQANEGYTFFYNTLPYQGILDSSTQGLIETEGPAIITTAGSGAITNNIYNAGAATFYGTTLVTGTGTDWFNNLTIDGTVRPGYVISANADSTREYRIASVTDSTTLHIDTIAFRSGSPEAYQIIAKDQPSFGPANIIDRFPAYSALNDSTANSDQIAINTTDFYPILETRVVSRVQDIANLPSGSFWVGLNTADRGRSTIHIPGAPFGKGNLELKFERVTANTYGYKKVYQSYIFNNENTGRLYLMVVGSETDNVYTPTAYNPCFFNQASNNDSVDLFELPGRPIIVGRIQ